MSDENGLKHANLLNRLAKFLIRRTVKFGGADIDEGDTHEARARRFGSGFDSGYFIEHGTKAATEARRRWVRSHVEWIPVHRLVATALLPEFPAPLLPAPVLPGLIVLEERIDS